MSPFITLSRFLELLHSLPTPDAGHYWEVSSTGQIRIFHDGLWYTPLTAVTESVCHATTAIGNFYFLPNEWQKAGVRLGLRAETTERIQKAVHRLPGHDRELRQKILSILDLRSDMTET